MIADIYKSGYYKLGKLNNIRNVLDTNLKITLVKCFILTKIDYCNFLFSNVPMKEINRLQKLLNASVRFIFNLRRSVSITPYLKKSHILPVKFRIQYKLSLYVFKTIHGLAPSYICNLLHRRPQHRENLRSSSDTTVMETCYSDGTIAGKMCQAWNCLPSALRNTSTIECFKKNLKTHYFLMAFN